MSSLRDNELGWELRRRHGATVAAGSLSASQKQRLLELQRLFLDAPTPERREAFAREVRQLLPVADLLGPLDVVDQALVLWELAVPHGAVRRWPDSPALADAGGGVLLVTEADCPELRSALGERCEVLAGVDASLPALLEALNQRDLRALHLRFSWDPNSDQLSWQGVRVGRSRLAQCLQGLCPPTVFFEPLPVGEAPTDRQIDLESLDQWARLLLDCGAGTVVLPAWPSPRLSRVASRLYGHLQGGSSMLEAFQLLRSQADPDDLAEHSLLLYGQPEVRWHGETQTTAHHARRPDIVLEVLEGPDAGRIIPLFSGTGRIRLGGPGLHKNEIEIDDPGLDSQLAMLERDGTDWLLTNLTAQGDKLKVNGLGVARQVRLSVDDRIAAGQTVLRMRLPAPPGSSQTALTSLPENRYSLALLHNGQLEQKFRLSSGLSVVGRKADCNLVVHDPAVSRQQVAVVFREGSFWATHLGSNPTLINGVIMEADWQLGHGDELHLSKDWIVRFQDEQR